MYIVMIKSKSENQQKKMNIKFPLDDCSKKCEGVNYQIVDLLT